LSNVIPYLYLTKHMKYLLYCLFFILPGLSAAQTQKEDLVVTWPKEYKFKNGYTIDNTEMSSKEFVPVNESVLKWTIARTTFLQGKGATLSVLETNDSTKNWWAIYKIEGVTVPVGKKSESTLYYNCDQLISCFTP